MQLNCVDSFTFDSEEIELLSAVIIIHLSLDQILSSPLRTNCHEENPTPVRCFLL